MSEVSPPSVSSDAAAHDTQTQLTERQQFWLEHLRACAKANKTTKDYVQAHGLSVKAQGKNGKTGKAHQGLAFIQKLHRVETEAQHLQPEQRRELRQEKAIPIRPWLDQSLPKVLPGSAPGKALQYLHNEWEELAICSGDGQLEIYNNPAAIRHRPSGSAVQRFG